MCQTIPIKVKNIKDDSAVLEDGRIVNISLFPDLVSGDWILVNANYAIEKISEIEALEIINIINGISKKVLIKY